MQNVVQASFGSVGTIPSRTLYQLNRYQHCKSGVGGFVTAVLCNDLQMATSLADAENLQALKHICRYVYNNLPAESWGNPERVQAWLQG